MSLKKIDQIKNEINRLIYNSKRLSSIHPSIVVIVMHELFRNLYPYDPYIKKKKSKYEDNLLYTVKNLNQIIGFSQNLGTYFNKLKINKYNTQSLFGKLWLERYRNKKLNSSSVLKDLLKRSKIQIDNIKNKNVLDLGCGSGRFTIALAKLGTKSCTGIDLGIEGLNIGKSLSKQMKLKNIKFKKGNVLNLPFKDKTFDFIFCKGVLHHTGNTYKGLEELLRVLKPKSKAFIYLYGKGGIFWNTRKLMRSVMRKIPINYTINILNSIGMPSRRTIFVDSWYVPIEDHIDKNNLESWFKTKNLKFRKYKKAKKTELEYYENKEKNFSELFGNGELRYIIEKNE